MSGPVANSYIYCFIESSVNELYYLAINFFSFLMFKGLLVESERLFTLSFLCLSSVHITKTVMHFLWMKYTIIYFLI